MADPTIDCLDHVEAPVFLLEPDAENIPRYVAWNTYAEVKSNLSREAVIGKTARDIFGKRMGQNAFERHVHAVKTGQSATYEIELPINEQQTWLRTTLNPLRDETGAVYRIIGTSTDISAEHEANRLRACLATAASEMEQFIAIAAHDLRTPMRNIKTLVEMLREDFKDHNDGKVDLINLLEEVAHKSGNMIADVLTHAHDANVLPQKLPFDFGQLCQNVRDVLDPQALHDILCPEVTLQGDKVAFQIVLRNLLDNAIKHGGKENLQIAISVHQSTRDMVAVRVQDDGVGFANPGREFIDTGKFRADSGYGLLGVRRLLTARGGSIDVKPTQDDVGGVVTFSLPGIIAASPMNAVNIPPLREIRQRASR